MQVSVSITKSVDFQGKQDEFSNVYEFTGVTDSDDAISTLVDRVVAIERDIFANDVSFKRARAWGGDGILGNVMRVSKDLSGTGNGLPSAGMYRECAIMIRWPLPTYVGTFASLSNPRRRVTRYLRKYLHTSMLHGYDGAGQGAPASSALPPALSLYGRDISAPLAGVNLCAPNGDLPTGVPIRAPYLEHRQFPRGRKEGLG